MIIMLKRWFYKRELKYWRYELLSIELALEYSNLQDSEEAERLIQAHEDCVTIINGLKILIENIKK